MRMRNITVSVPDDTYRRARVLAAEKDVSLSFLVAAVIDTLPEMRALEQRIHFREEGYKNLPPQRPGPYRTVSVPRDKFKNCK
jgi:hypothetical protein